MTRTHLIDLYDGAVIASDQMDYLLSIFNAISTAAKVAGHDTPEERQQLISIRELAKVGSYLAMDFSNQHDVDAERLNGELAESNARDSAQPH